MSTYTTEEIQTAVERLVRGSIRRPFDTLGTRRPDVTFSDVQEAAAGVFILYPLAPFYAVFLGSKRVLDAVQAEAAVVGELRALVGAIGRRVLPVEEVENLFNASSALFALEGAVAQTAPKDITKLPAFQRFALNAQEFLVRHGSKVKENGEIVPTPQEARQRVPEIVRDLKASHDALIAAVTAISGSVDDYNNVNLPSLVARGVVSKAREVLGGHADTLEAMLPEERLGSIRAVVLDVLAAKAVVQKFGSFAGVQTFFALTGTGTPYSDALRLSTPASITSTIAGSYKIRQDVNDTLKITADSGTEDTIRLQRSLVATLSGIRAETTTAGGTGFIIGNGTTPAIPTAGGGKPPNNNQLKLRFKSLINLSGTLLTVTFTLSGLSGNNAIPRTAQQICDDINTALTGASLNTKWKAEPYFLPAHFFGEVDTGTIVGDTMHLTSPLGVSNLGFVIVGDLVNIPAGPNAGLWTVTVVTSSVDVTVQKIGATPVVESQRFVEIGPSKRAVRVVAIDLATQLVDEDSVEVEADSQVVIDCAMELGISQFGRAFCRPTTAQQVADDINVKLPKKLLCSAIVDSSTSRRFRTEPSISDRLVLSKLRTTADVVFTPGAPNSIAVTLSANALSAAGVVVGDRVVLRGGNPANTTWLITTIVGGVVTATSSDSGVSATGVTVEFGPSVTLTRWNAIDITTGPLADRYHIAGQGPSGLDVALLTPLPTTSDAVTKLELIATGVLGPEKVVFGSRLEQVASAIEFGSTGNTALAHFFSVTPAKRYGTSPWFQLPAAVPVLSVGDVLETFATQYNVPSNTYEVLGVSDKIVEISPEMPSNESWSFNDQPPPYAKLKHGHTVNFGLYKELLDEWLERSINQETYFTDLNRYLNPLLVNATPTAEQLGTALAHLETLLDYLIVHDDISIPLEDALESILKTYVVDPVGALDTLISAYREKGADRAIDLLVAGKFSSFFSMDVHDVSYSGTMQKAMREVMQDDLPVRKVNRAETNQSLLVGTATSVDHEFDFSDAETGHQPDPPADFDDTPR